MIQLHKWRASRLMRLHCCHVQKGRFARSGKFTTFLEKHLFWNIEGKLEQEHKVTLCPHISLSENPNFSWIFLGPPTLKFLFLNLKGRSNPYPYKDLPQQTKIKWCGGKRVKGARRAGGGKKWHNRAKCYLFFVSHGSFSENWHLCESVLL